MSSLVHVLQLILNQYCGVNKLPEVFTASCQYDFVPMETLPIYSKDNIAVFIIQKQSSNMFGQIVYVFYLACRSIRTKMMMAAHCGGKITECEFS